ncbi:MAG: heavy metal-associated domain-containing protein [Planctomycetota bacterium]
MPWNTSTFVLSAGLLFGITLPGCAAPQADAHGADRAGQPTGPMAVEFSSAPFEVPIGVSARAEMTGLSVGAIEATGMSCPLCATNIDSVLMRHPGVGDVVVDLGAGRVYVGLVPGAEWPSAEQLADAVRDAGFTPVKVSLPEGGAS